MLEQADVDIEVLRSLYGRAKGLGLGVGAAIALDAPAGTLAGQAATLQAEAADAAARAVGPTRDALVCAARAAATLADVLVGDESDQPTLLDEARSAQRALRRAAWPLLGCEYEPCGASPTPPPARPPTTGA